jgi:uncharacterized membrane protein
MNADLEAKTVGNKEPFLGEHTKRGYSLERLIFFSDGVFAIAITLLALDLRLPEGAGMLPPLELVAALGTMWQKYLAYVISFLAIGSFWISHHRKFRYVIGYNHSLLVLNLLFLMVIAFIPFPTSLISVSSDAYVTIFYAATMVAGSIMMALLWGYASAKHRLIELGLSKKVIHSETILPLATGGIFLASIGIAFIDPDLAKISWILVLFVSLLSHRN